MLWILLGVLVSVAAARAAWVPSGNDDIDQMRKSAAASPTTAENARQRQALLYLWYRLLMHQGFDLTKFEPVRQKLLETDGESRFRAIGEGYRVLESIQSSQARIQPRRSNAPDRAERGNATDWPVYHGNPAQTGSTSDAGPTRGELVWRFAVRQSWTARPAIEAGRVYVASPGMATVMYCLDEKSGKLIWKAWQYSVNYHQPLPADSEITLLKEQAIVRQSASNGDAAQLVYVDKATGKLVRTTAAGPSETRWEPASLASEEKFLVYKHERFSTVVVKLADSGRIWWTFHVGRMFGEPVVAGDYLYAATDSGLLYCLRLKAPERVAWIFQAGAPLRGTATVADGRVYVGASDGTFYAIDAETGQMRWLYRVRREDRALQLFSTATVANGRVYVSSANQFVYCFDAASGKLLWEHNVRAWVRARPLVLGHVAYVAAVNGEVWAIADNNTAGRVLWKHKIADGVFADLVGDQNGLLVSASDLFLFSLSPQDGRLQWKHSLLECSYIDGERVLADAEPDLYQSSPIAVQGWVFIGGPNRFVYALDASTGSERWRFETSGKISAAPIFGEGRVYFGQFGGDQDFYAVDARSGQLIWKRAIGWGWASPGYSDGRIYVGTTQGDFLCLDASDGTVLWARRLGGGVYTAPAIDETSVYMGSWDGYYYAFDKQTGHLRWAYSRPGWPYDLGGRPDSASPVLWKGKLLVQVLGHYLVALDKTTGRSLWEFSAPPGHFLNGTPAVSRDQIFASVLIEAYNCPAGAKLLALDDESGSVLWEYPGGGGLTPAVVARNSVLFGSTTNVFFTSVSAKTRADGSPQVLWRYQLGGVVEESVPAVYGDKVFVMANDGYLYALR